MTCAHPLELARLVEYWSQEASDAEVETIEAHIFACDQCAAEAERVARIVTALRTQLPPVITAAQLAEFREKGVPLEENVFVPGTRKSVTFAPSLQLLIHHLTGLPLHDAERVTVTVRSEGTGRVIYRDPLAPFDRDRGEVLIACQRHFGGLPADTMFEVEVQARSAPPTIATYYVPHVFVP